MCALSSTYGKAKKLADYGMVEIISARRDEYGGLIIDAIAEGSYSNEYEVQLQCDADGDIEDYFCDCPAYESYSGMCKHCAAAVMQFLEEHKEIVQEKNQFRLGVQKARTDPAILDVMEMLAQEKRMNEQEADGTIELIPEIREEKGSYYYPRRRYVSFRIGNEKKYVLKNLSSFAEAVLEEKQVSYGKQLSFVHCKSAFTKDAWNYVQYILGLEAYYQEHYQSMGRRVELNEELFAGILYMSLGKEIDYECEGRRYKTLQILDQNPPIKCRLKENEDGFRLSVPFFEKIEGSPHLFVKINNKVYRCRDGFEKAMDVISMLASEEQESEYRIFEEDMPAFCSTVMEVLEREKAVDKNGISLEEYQPKEAQFRFYLDEEAGAVTLKTEAVYGEEIYNLLQAPSASYQCRNMEKERAVLHTAKAYFKTEDFKENVLSFDAKDEDSMYQLLNTGIRQLEEWGEVFATDKIKTRRVVRNSKTQVGVSLKSGLLELSVDSDIFSREELVGILDAYRKRKKYYRLKSGDFLNLEEDAAGAAAELLDGLALPKGKLLEDTIELPKYRALYIDQVLQQKKEQMQVKQNPDYKEMIRNMKNVESSDFAVPESLETVLRSYQKTGYRWLRTLEKLGFGGILADDMGLGKTLQTIACLLAMKQERGHVKSLIVCPASLVYNWKREFETFAPELQVKMMVGSAQQREELLADRENGDIWITSYDTAKRDIALYRDIEFDIEVIDEAQNIKNHGTQAAKAVKQIQAPVKFALTGTPIENRLSELWSIFDYLMPGLLGTHERFRKEYEQPIMREKDQEKTEQLKKMILPFILRKIKGDVLKELPDKMEQVVYSEMETEQKKLYQAHVHKMLETLQKQSEEEIRTGKLQILAELTRLRQICCAPELVYEDYQDEACKVETCMELISQAVEGNHKVLLFSQFTSIFPILEKRLKRKKIPYYILTGQTPKEQRMQMTEEFNKNDIPLFLISLKAGGTGLNLTAANIVIHFDPWWNLAAQNQATDRAHRIGQEQQVIVFKLIVKDTIEEKIVRMQEEKQKLASQILEGEAISAAKLTKEDLLEILNG
jgi:SNF2 family DNA or RNA helicase